MKRFICASLFLYHLHFTLKNLLLNHKSSVTGANLLWKSHGRFACNLKFLWEWGVQIFSNHGAKRIFLRYTPGLYTIQYKTILYFTFPYYSLCDLAHSIMRDIPTLMPTLCHCRSLFLAFGSSPWYSILRCSLSRKLGHMIAATTAWKSFLSGGWRWLILWRG